MTSGVHDQCGLYIIYMTSVVYGQELDTCMYIYCMYVHVYSSNWANYVMASKWEAVHINEWLIMALYCYPTMLEYM